MFNFFGKKSIKSSIDNLIDDILKKNKVTDKHIELCYRLILGRPSDPAGAESFLRYISKARNITPYNLAQNFFTSAEFMAKNTKLLAVAFEERLVEIKVNGINVLVPDNDWVYEQNVVAGLDSYEPWVCDAIKRNLHSGSVFIDIGANAGVHTMVASQIVGSDGLVYAVDASLENCRTIQSNIRRYNANNVVIVPVALSDSTTIENISLDSTGSNKVVRPDSEAQQATAFNFERILCGRLDDLLPPLSRLDLIKIDVEGREQSVLRGAHKLISDYKPKIIAEFHPAAPESAYVDDLLSMGYSVSIIGPGDHTAVKCQDRAELIHYFDNGAKAPHFDLLLSP